MSAAPLRGDRIVQASWAGTALFSLTAGLAAAVRAAAPVALAVALVLFAAGAVCYVVAFAEAVGRSRVDDVSVGALFFLMGGVASRSVAVHLLCSTCAQVAVAVATAAVRVNSSLAFGILAPVYGLSLVALWAARHGTFPPRPPRPSHPARREGPTRSQRAARTEGSARPARTARSARRRP